MSHAEFKTKATISIALCGVLIATVMGIFVLRSQVSAVGSDQNSNMDLTSLKIPAGYTLMNGPDMSNPWYTDLTNPSGLVPRKCFNVVPNTLVLEDPVSANKYGSARDFEVAGVNIIGSSCHLWKTEFYALWAKGDCLQPDAPRPDGTIPNHMNPDCLVSGYPLPVEEGLKDALNGFVFQSSQFPTPEGVIPKVCVDPGSPNSINPLCLTHGLNYIPHAPTPPGYTPAQAVPPSAQQNSPTPTPYAPSAATNATAVDPNLDSDKDGLTDWQEINVYHTDPNNPDTDGDGFTDGVEVSNGYNPNGSGKLILSVADKAAMLKSVDKTLTKKMSGMILLQVENHGEAWYVNPADGKRYFVKDGNAAYQIMQKFGVGISNGDLSKIPIGTMNP